MDFSNIEQILIELASDYTLSNKKYYSTSEKKVYKKDEAISRIFGDFTQTHPVEYQPFMAEKKQLQDHIAEILKKVTKSKKDKQANAALSRSLKGQESSGMSAKLVTNPLWQPTNTFNEVDAAWCNGLVLDDANTLYKRRADGSLVVIDQLNKNKLMDCVNKVVKLQDIPEPVQHCRDRMAVLTILAKEAEATKPYGYDGLVELLKKDYGTILNRAPTNQTLQQFLGIADSELHEIKDAEALTSKMVYHALDRQLPASSMWGLASIAKIYNTFLDDDDNEHSVFDGFKVSTKGNQPFTRSKYFESVLAEESEYMEHIPKRPVPVACRDKDGKITEPAFGIFNKELYEADKKKYGDLDYNDSVIVKTFLEPMDVDQRKWTLAWYYAVFFSFILGAVIISRLHEDGGGTLKTTVKNFIRYAMVRYFGADVTFSMKRGELLDNQYLFDSKRKISLADCLYCMYDEPNDRGELWEVVKAKTGNPTVEMIIKQLYINPFSVESSVVFDFGSNKTIYLTEPSAFARRLGIIRTSAKNTYKKIPVADFKELSHIKNGELNERQLREFHLLMRLGEAYYKEIIETYGSLAEAANQMPSMAKELEDTAPWNEHYMKFYEALFNDKPDNVGKDIPLKIANDALREKLAVYIMKLGKYSTIRLDESGLVRFFKSIHYKNDTIKLYYTKTKSTVRGWALYRPEQKDNEHYTEVVDSLTEYGLNDDGSVIPSAPETVLINGSAKANYAELNRRQKEQDEQDMKDIEAAPDLGDIFG